MKLPITIALFSAAVLLPCAAQTVTFSEHIAPIIYNNCTTCHREGEIGPMSFTNYEEVFAYADAIGQVTSEKIMPPWPPDRGFSRFVGERGLTDDQLTLITDWVAAGAPKGDSNKEPELPDYPEGSVLGEPDLTLTMSESFTTRGDGKDEYRVFVLPTGLLEDKDVVAVEFRPGNAEIVHHALLSLDETGKARQLEREDARGGYRSFGGFGVSIRQGLAWPGWVPGETPRFFPGGTGLKLAAGTDILLQIHYAPITRKESDQSSLNLFFAKEPIEREVQSRLMLPSDLVDSNDEYLRLNPLLGLLAGGVIAGGVENFVGESITPAQTIGLARNETIDTVFGEQLGGTVAGFLEFDIPANRTRSFRGKWEIPKDISLLGVWPHMHYLGTDWEIVLERPDGSQQNLIRIGEWDFNWQGNYTFPKYIRAPKGSTIFATAGYDNTRNNIYNPNNPPEDVNWGEKTTDEMYFLPFSFVDYREGDENLSLEEFSPGDLPAFRIDGLTESEIQFRLQAEAREYVIERSNDMKLWQRVTSTETAKDETWRTLTLPRTAESAGFYRAVLFQVAP